MDALDFGAEAHLDDRRCGDLPVRRRHDVEAERPALARLQHKVEKRLAVVRAHAWTGQEDLRPLHRIRGYEDNLAIAAVELGRSARRKPRGAIGMPQRKVPLLHGEDVREISFERQPEPEARRHDADIPHEDRVGHAGRADEPPTVDGDTVLRQGRRHAVAEEERGREVLHLPGREQERARAVETQFEARQEPGVVREQTCRALADVTEVVAEAERRTFKDRQHRMGRTEIRGRYGKPARNTPERLQRCVPHERLPVAQQRCDFLERVARARPVPHSWSWLLGGCGYRLGSRRASSLAVSAGQGE